jgi:uncharacterized protein (DUF1330 family)
LGEVERFGNAVRTCASARGRATARRQSQLNEGEQDHGSLHHLHARGAYQETNAKGGRTEGMEALVVYGDLQGLEGEAPDGAVVLKFENREKALEWYNRPIYQEAIKHRMKAAHYRVFVVDGL